VTGGLNNYNAEKLLIVQENNDKTPDDNVGGIINFKFDSAVSLQSIDLFDVKNDSTTISFNDINGDLISSFTNTFNADTNGNGTNLYGTMNFGSVTGVYSMQVNFNNTYGGLDNIVLTSALPEPSTYALMLAGLGLVGFMARRRKV